MERLSKEYGWTPNEIREMRIDDLQAYMDILSIRSKLEQAEMKRAKRKK